MKISSVMPVLNGEKYLSSAINSFLSQDYDNKQLVIVDGMSTDHSHKIIEQFVSKHPDQITWVKKPDSGLSNARNIGVSHASGDVIGFMSSDDILHRGVYDKINYYNTLCKYDLIYFSCLVYDKKYKECYPGHQPLRKFSKKNLLKGHPITAGECFYYKRFIFDQFKFDETNKYSMDFEFNLQIACDQSRQYTHFCVNEPGLIVCLHDDNISNKFKSLQEKETQETLYKYNARNKRKSIFRKLTGF